MDHLIQSVFYGNPDQYPPIINSARLLAEAGFQLDIFCRSDASEWNVTYPSAVRIHRLKTGTSSSWVEYAGFIVKVLRQASKDASVFVGHDMHGLLPAKLLAARRRRPLVYHCHDFTDQSRTLPLGSRVVRSFEKRFARSADLVIVPDADRAKVIEPGLGLKREALIVANAPLTRPPERSDSLRKALLLNGRNLARVLFRQGRIDVGHAIEATLRSIPLWTNRDWGFVVMGTAEPSYAERLNGIARELGVEGQFLILPPVGYDQVAGFTLGADVGHALYEPIHVNNSFIATASNKIMEYMEAGIPLLVSDTPLLRKLVTRHQCGVTADEKSAESIAKAVNALLGDPEAARLMGEAARRAFEEEFCYERQFAPAINVFKQLSLNSSAGLQGARIV